LTEDLLEQVRLISNIETDDRKLLQIVLMGQPELRDRLNSPRLKQLRQRITVRYHLNALTLTRIESGQYIHHRLELAGSRGASRFSRTPALWRVYLYSGGIPASRQRRLRQSTARRFCRAAATALITAWSAAPSANWKEKSIS
jgi:general secretion pathway protein A